MFVTGMRNSVLFKYKPARASTAERSKCDKITYDEQFIDTVVPMMYRYNVLLRHYRDTNTLPNIDPDLLRRHIDSCKPRPPRDAQHYDMDSHVVAPFRVTGAAARAQVVRNLYGPPPAAAGTKRKADAPLETA